MQTELARLLIGGTHSGCGKTTITSAILQAFVNRGIVPAAFKCGPDYIDPMFHSAVIGTPSRNLDLFLCDEDTVRALLAQNAAHAPLAILEGVMGYYDGVGGTSERASACDLARCTATPSVLVLSVQGMSLSAAAMLSGFLNFRENTVRGVILNGVSTGMYTYYRDIIESQTGVRVYGHLPRDEAAHIGSRHLGLITAAEIEDLRARLGLLARYAEDCINLDGLLALARSAPQLSFLPKQTKRVCTEPIRIAVARDAAFCFYYEDNFDLLRAMGATLVPFSPLTDCALPEDIDGLYLGGGYPELYADKLSANTSILGAIRNALCAGLPTIAECGGFMLLHEAIIDREGRSHAMAGVIEGTAAMQTRLQHFGYATLTAERDTMLLKRGETMRVHEFHYAASTDTGDACIARKPLREVSWHCVHGTQTLFAGYPHLLLYARPQAAEAFVRQCDLYRQAKRGSTTIGRL